MTCFNFKLIVYILVHFLHNYDPMTTCYLQTFKVTVNVRPGFVLYVNLILVYGFDLRENRKSFTRVYHYDVFCKESSLLCFVDV